MFLISGADRKLENVTEGSWDGSHFQGVIKTQRLYQKWGEVVWDILKVVPPFRSSWHVCLPYEIWRSRGGGGGRTGRCEGQQAAE